MERKLSKCVTFVTGTVASYVTLSVCQWNQPCDHLTIRGLAAHPPRVGVIRWSLPPSTTSTSTTTTTTKTTTTTHQEWELSGVNVFGAPACIVYSDAISVCQTIGVRLVVSQFKVKGSLWKRALDTDYCWQSVSDYCWLVVSKSWVNGFLRNRADVESTGYRHAPACM